MTPLSTTRVDEVYAEVRLAILNGDLAPGSRMLATALCEAYDVSSGVLREALMRLAGDGLVVALPQRGFRVIEVSADDLMHLTECRVLVETALIEQSVSSGDLDVEMALTAAHHRLTRIPMLDQAGRPSPEWLEAHRAFHAQLLAGSPNLRLRGIAASLRDAAEVYLCWSRTISGDLQRDVAAEHQQLLAAALAHEPELAADLLRKHIERTTRALLNGRPSGARSERPGQAASPKSAAAKGARS